ncbi:MAG: hypothetical protein K9L70_14195, partial [Thiohalocapsa sp.]|nr:hypothetical protein [Thiohalocapsa sp.]
LTAVRLGPFGKGGVYLLGEEDSVWGFLLVMIDVAREVLTAMHAPGEYSAPIKSREFRRKPQ